MKKTIDFYTHTKSEFEKEAVVLKSKSVKLSVFRFAVFLITCFLVYYNFGNYPIVFTIAFFYRLDRLTSGLLLFGRNPKKAREMEQQIRTRQVQKEYVCRVEGEFPT